MASSLPPIAGAGAGCRFLVPSPARSYRRGMPLRRWLRALFPLRALPAPRPELVRARLELDAVDVDGRTGAVEGRGVFFVTSAPIARGVRGRLRRAGSDERIPVRVAWQRAAGPGRPAGLGLAFE
jgi:hypothetical protein